VPLILARQPTCLATVHSWPSLLVWRSLDVKVESYASFDRFATLAVRDRSQDGLRTGWVAPHMCTANGSADVRGVFADANDVVITWSHNCMVTYTDSWPQRVREWLLEAADKRIIDAKLVLSPLSSPRHYRGRSPASFVLHAVPPTVYLSQSDATPTFDRTGRWC
jgi:hypothetical protein